jgi:hypothetical protein
MAVVPPEPLRCVSVAAVLALGVAACTSTSGSPSPSFADAGAEGESPDAAAVCSDDDAYTPETIVSALTKQGTSGALGFELVSASPLPPVLDYNTWVLQLRDASGQLVTDATFPTIGTWMPLHRHGSSIAPTYVSNGDGTYTITLYLFMAGLWQVTFDAQAGSTTDSVTFTFCIGG